MLLCLRMHIGRADGDNRCAAVADFLALFIVLLAERFCEELNVPFRNRFQVVPVRHHDLNVAAVALGCCEFQCGVQHGGILEKIIRLLAGFVHISRAFKELFNIKSNAGSERQADLTEDGETAADAIRNSKGIPALFCRQLFEQRRLFRIRVGDGDDFDIDIRLLAERIVDHHEVRHGIECTAGLRDDEQEHLEILLLMRSGNACESLHVMDEVARCTRVDIVAAEVDARITAALFL